MIFTSALPCLLKRVTQVLSPLVGSKSILTSNFWFLIRLFLKSSFHSKWSIEMCGYKAKIIQDSDGHAQKIIHLYRTFKPLF